MTVRSMKLHAKVSVIMNIFPVYINNTCTLTLKYVIALIGLWPSVSLRLFPCPCTCILHYMKQIQTTARIDCIKPWPYNTNFWQ